MTERVETELVELERLLAKVPAGECYVTAEDYDDGPIESYADVIFGDDEGRFCSCVAGDTDEPSHRERAELISALRNHAPALIALARRTTAAEAEREAIEYAAHMPADYQHGLPSWINQKLYAAYIGLHFSDEVLKQINTGRLRFEDSPDAKRVVELEAELARLRGMLRIMGEWKNHPDKVVEETQAALDAEARRLAQEART
jgi:hypothetical protein